MCLDVIPAHCGISVLFALNKSLPFFKKIQHAKNKIYQLEHANADILLPNDGKL